MENLGKCIITGRVSFGSFKTGKWHPSKTPITYETKSLKGRVVTKLDMHISTDDGTIVTVPAYDATAQIIARTQIADPFTGEYRPIQNGDVIRIRIPSATWKEDHTYSDKYLGAELLGHYYRAPYVEFVYNKTEEEEKQQFAAARGFKSTSNPGFEAKMKGVKYNLSDMK